MEFTEEKLLYPFSNGNNPRKLLATSSLCGDEVKNTEDEVLGEIKDFMVNVNSGEIAYAVLSVGGFLGLGDKLFAVPWKNLTVNEKEKCFILPVKKEHLEHAPGFNKDSWPDQEDPNWEDKVKKYYSCDEACDKNDKDL